MTSGADFTLSSHNQIQDPRQPRIITDGHICCAVSYDYIYEIVFLTMQFESS